MRSDVVSTSATPEPGWLGGYALRISFFAITWSR